MASCFERESESIKYCKPVEGFLDRLWVGGGGGRWRGGGDEVRQTLTTAKYPYLATEDKQIQIADQVNETMAAAHGQAFDRPCFPSYPTG